MYLIYITARDPLSLHRQRRLLFLPHPLLLSIHRNLPSILPHAAVLIMRKLRRPIRHATGNALPAPFHAYHFPRFRLVYLTSHEHGARFAALIAPFVSFRRVVVLFFVFVFGASSRAFFSFLSLSLIVLFPLRVAALRARRHFVPTSLPFFPPRKWSVTYHAYLLRKVFLLHAVRHASRRGGLDASSRISGISFGRNERNEMRRRDGGLDDDDASSSFIAGRNETNEKTRRRAEGHMYSCVTFDLFGENFTANAPLLTNAQALAQ